MQFSRKPLFRSAFFLGAILVFISTLSFADSPSVPAGADSVPAATSSGSGTAPAGQPAAAAKENPGMGSMLLPFALMFVIIYFLMIRPQNKKMKEHQSVLQKIKRGDEVVTQSGILGTITGVTEKVVTLEISRNVPVKILKSQIAQIVDGKIKDLA